MSVLGIAYAIVFLAFTKYALVLAWGLIFACVVGIDSWQQRRGTWIDDKRDRHL